MKLDKWKNKKIAILGLGIEGFATAKYLLKKGLQVTVLDKKTKEELETENKKSVEVLTKLGAGFVLGNTYLENMETFDVIVRSPGISILKKELQHAKKKGTLITSQTQLFFDLCPCPIIGVTGTKGKGTTSSLIYEMLKKQEKDAYLGGNIGRSPLEFLDTLNDQSIVILELSSFQLQDITKSPHIAVILMITSEHLDYHASTGEYVSAKRNILRFQTKSDFAIINRDYPASNESDIHTEGKVYFVSREQECEQGCFIKDNAVWLGFKGRDEKIINTSEILLLGKHNWENVCAAVMAATLTSVSKANIISVLKTFKGLEHRLELVAEINGVKYYDDSFSTTPETAIAAIEAFEQPEILILGGSSKGSDFLTLGEVINTAKNIKAIIGIGVEWQKIKARIKKQDSGIKIIEGCKNMREIVVEAWDISESGDIVLLSPACASFDMFKNYKDRGEQFKREVKNLVR